MGPNRTVDEQEALSALLSLYGSVGDEGSSENIIGRKENAVGRTKQSQPADEEQIQGEEKEELEGRGSASASGGNGFEIKDGSGGDVSTCETKEEKDDLQKELIDPSQNSASYLPPSPVSPIAAFPSRSRPPVSSLTTTSFIDPLTAQKSRTELGTALTQANEAQIVSSGLIGTSQQASSDMISTADQSGIELEVSREAETEDTMSEVEKLRVRLWGDSVDGAGGRLDP